MSEEERNWHEEEVMGLVRRFESMLAQDQNLYFDLDEFETIIEYYVEAGKFAEASKVIRYATELFPDSTVLMLREAQILASSGHLERALPRLKNLLAFEPQNEEIHLSLAAIYSQLQDHHQSVRHLEEALRLADKDLRSDIFIDLALEYENLNHLSKAIDVLKRALLENPDNETAIHELAFCFEMNGQIKESIHYYEQFIDRYPYSYISWYNLGNAWMKLDNTEKAIDAFDFALVIQEDFGPAWFNRGMAKIHAEQYDTAVEDLETVLKLEGAQASTYCYIGECYEKMDKYDEAIIHYRLSLESNEDYAESWVGLGVVHDLTGKVKESLSFFRKALELEKDNVEFHFLFAEALRKAGNTDEAREVYLNLLVLDPVNEDAWLEYTDLLAERYDLTEASEQIDIALGNCPESVPIKFRKVAYLHSLGKKKEAYSLLQELLPAHGNQSDELTDYYPEIRKDPNYLELCDLYGK